MGAKRLREPIVWQRSDEPFKRPPRETATLILQDVAALGAADQNRLREWLQEPTQHAQVVSMSATPVFPLVVRGLFDATLYYRLNVMLLRVTEGIR